MATSLFALVFASFFTPFKFEYDVVSDDHSLAGDDLALWVSVGDGIIEEIEVDGFVLSQSRTRASKRMTLFEFVLFQCQDPVFELNPDRPTLCYE